MTPEERERMDALVEQIQVEKNHVTFIALVEELNELLGGRAERMVADGKPKSEEPPPISSVSSK